MERLQRSADHALRALLVSQPHSPAKVSFAWAMAAGPAVARATTVDCRNGLVVVTARTPAWAREVRRNRPILVERLRQFLGRDVVTDVRVAVAGNGRRAGRSGASSRSGGSSGK
jgi:predicted nucleic acid-binding Zn ribbon protein